MARHEDATLEAPQEQTRKVLGFLFGAGGIGAAIGLLPAGAEPWVVLVLVVLLLSFAGGMFYWSERVVGQRIASRQRSNLSNIGAAYQRSLTTTGQLLAANLETIAARGDVGVEETRPYVLRKLAEHLRKQSEQELGDAEEAEWVRTFRTSVQSSVSEWVGLADAAMGEGTFPPDGQPIRVA